ncbi:hypothetical protein H5071_03360 [Shewanella sp. SR41-2]|nr:hypothetical protein [Shewanella sp. SR41-2]
MPYLLMGITELSHHITSPNKPNSTVSIVLLGALLAELSLAVQLHSFSKSGDIYERHKNPL